MADRQRTIAREAELSGTGLHSGAATRVVFKPAPPDSGVRFVRTDLEGRPEIPVAVESAVTGEDFARRTTIGSDEVSVGTVEHILATARGLGIDNVTVEIDAPEPPEPDGSCAPYLEVFRRAGVKEQNAEKSCFVLREPVAFSEGDIELAAYPYDGFKISFTIDYEHPLIGRQHISLEINEEVFEKEIAPARTFSLLKDVESLKARGLIKGGSLANSVVVGDDGILNDGALRFEDEFVRHKVLDLLGDLGLLGRPLKMHVVSLKSGHSTNLKFVRLLKQKLSEDQKGLAPGRQVREVPSSLTIDQIQKIMPHRYPFLLVDRILSLDPGKSVVGIKNVTINEPFFVGHFPSGPIMPAVLIIEAMAQVGGVMLLSMVENSENKLVYFMGIDKAKFRRPVVPGDQIRFELEMIRFRMKTCKMRGKAYVDDAVVAEAELTSVVVDKPGLAD